MTLTNFHSNEVPNRLVACSACLISPARYACSHSRRDKASSHNSPTTFEVCCSEVECPGWRGEPCSPISETFAPSRTLSALLGRGAVEVAFAMAGDRTSDLAGMFPCALDALKLTVVAGFRKSAALGLAWLTSDRMEGRSDAKARSMKVLLVDRG
jgi:hypothetical protein